MAYTAPTTRATGDLITASIWNTDLVDNIVFLEANSDFRLIQDEDKTSDGASFDFTGIPATYKHLRIVATLRGTTVATTQIPWLRFNNDSAGNYRDGNGTAQARIATLTPVPGASATAGSFGPYIADILNYADSGQWRTAFIKAGNSVAGATSAGVDTGQWMNTADAISRVTVLPAADNWLAGSRMSLYGLG